jgi:hypothetical protein
MRIGRDLRLMGQGIISPWGRLLSLFGTRDTVRRNANNSNKSTTTSSSLSYLSLLSDYIVEGHKSR